MTDMKRKGWSGWAIWLEWIKLGGQTIRGKSEGSRLRGLEDVKNEEMGSRLVLEQNGKLSQRGPWLLEGYRAKTLNTYITKIKHGSNNYIIEYHTLNMQCYRRYFSQSKLQTQMKISRFMSVDFIQTLQLG